MCGCILLGLTLLFPLTEQLTANVAIAEGMHDLSGVYLVVGIEKDGERLPEKEVEGQQVHITADLITVSDKDNRVTFEATYMVNATRSPWLIDMRSIKPQPGLNCRGLVKREGDTLWLIYHLPGGEVPCDFKTKDRQLMVILKKMV